MAHLIELDMADELSKLVLDMMTLGKPPQIPERYASISSMQTLYATLLSLRENLYAASNGDLSREVALKGFVGGALKTLQANLKHMTWQTKLVASGDFTQRMEFMGEFSQSFNAMVIQLDQTLKEITKKDAELSKVNDDLVKEVAIRKETESALSKVNDNLVKENAIRKEAEAALNRVNTDLVKEVAIRKNAELALRKSEEAFRKLSITDPLTGLFNRRKFNDEAEREIRRAIRYGHPLAAIMLDIDFFKHINDTFGHTCGDMVLKLVAKTTKEMLRAHDIPARYGGEEFIVLFPETPIEAAANIAERLRRRIQESITQTERGPITVTASFGVSEFLGKGDNKPSGKILSDFISQADQALYTSKNAGRNKVTVYHPVAEGLG